MVKWFISVVLIILSIIPASGQDDGDSLYEHILSFHCELIIDTADNLIVKERITVFADSISIKRGIYRSIPLIHDKKKLNFELVSVKRNDSSEHYYLKQDRAYVKILVGHVKEFIPRGIHTFDLVYKIKGAVENVDGSKQLNWNVTGNNWDFDIDLVEVDVLLPDDFKIANVDGWTGFTGDEGDDFISSKSENQAEFSTTRKLKVKEGLSILVSW